MPRFLSYMLCFLLTTSSLLFGQSSQIDSLKQALENATDTTRIKILIDLTEQLFNIADPEAEIYAREYFHLADFLDYEKGLIFSKYHRARMAFHKGDYPQALALFDECIVLFTDNYSPEYLCASYMQAGTVSRLLNSYDQALEYQMAGLKVSEASGSPLLIASSLRFIGQTYVAISEKDRALEYCLKAFSILEPEEQGIALARIALQIGVLYSQKGESELALDYYERSLEIAKKIGSRHQEMLSIQYIGNLYRMQHRSKEALVYLQQSLDICKEINDVRYTIYGLSELSMAHYQLGDYKKAKEIGILAYESAKGMPLEIQEDILPDLCLVLEAAADYKTALKFSNIYIAVKDSLNKEQDHREIGRIEAKYQFEKQREAEELLRLEKEHLAAERRQRDMILVFSGMGLLLLTVFFGIVYVRALGRKNRMITEQKEKIEAFSQVQSNFFSNISHEFRTPLTLILSPLKNIAPQIDNSDVRQELNVIERNAQKLMHLVNQILDLSKLESHEMKAHLKAGDVIACLKTITAAFDSIAQTHSITFRKTFAVKNLLADFDAGHFEKIFNNLLSNAFKFTPDGGRVIVDLGFQISDLKDKNKSAIRNLKSEISNRTGVIEVRIKDTGIGIPAKDLPHVFDRFYQVGGASTRAYEGTGIGLSLVKELVEFYDGDISIKSETGQGTEVTFRLPLTKIYLEPDQISDSSISDFGFGISDLKGQNKFPQELAETQVIVSEMPLSPDYGGRSAIRNPQSEIVLVVEDSDDLRVHIRQILGQGYRVLEAPDGVKGWQMAIDNIPDLIISDVMMPGTDGYELSRKLKTDTRTSHIPIILLTAKAAKDEKIEGLQTGADEYLTKPFDRDELLVRIKNLIENRAKLQKQLNGRNLLQLAEVEISSLDEEFLKKAVKAVEENIESESFSVEDLASEVGLSRAQLHRKIRALTNQPTSYFIRAIRLERAAQLIVQNAGNITEITYMTGFNSQPYFTKCFQEHFGVSPSEYRKSKHKQSMAE